MELKTKNFDELMEMCKGNLQLVMVFATLRLKVAQYITKHGEKYSSGSWESKSYSYEDKTLWTYEEISNIDKTWNIVNAENYSDFSVSNQTFSLIVWALTLSNFSMEVYESRDFDGKDDLLEELAYLHSLCLTNAHNILHQEELEKFNRFID